MDKERFFNSIRASLFNGSLSQDQVEGIQAILIACERQRLSEPATAYVLATAFHETGGRMMPVREAFGRSEAEAYHKVYNWLRRRGGTNYAKIDPETGQSYLGRGFAQLTWRDNYRRAGQKLDVDLEHEPEKALEPWLAARILVEGMNDGWFTGKSLSDYNLPEQFREARQIVNRMDKADLIAGYAERFHEALAS